MPARLVLKKRRSKYGNRKVTLGGDKFDSQKEADRWVVLCLMEQAGKIHDLQRQVKWGLEVNGIVVCFYVCDSTYIEKAERIIEDVKGVKTAMYRLKKKMVKAQYGIDIREV